MAEGIKSWLYAWLGKRKLTPNYEVRSSGEWNSGLRYIFRTIVIVTY